LDDQFSPKEKQKETWKGGENEVIRAKRGDPGESSRGGWKNGRTRKVKFSKSKCNETQGIGQTGSRGANKTGGRDSKRNGLGGGVDAFKKRLIGEHAGGKKVRNRCDPNQKERSVKQGAQFENTETKKNVLTKGKGGAKKKPARKRCWIGVHSEEKTVFWEGES